MPLGMKDGCPKIGLKMFVRLIYS